MAQKNRASKQERDLRNHVIFAMWDPGDQLPDQDTRDKIVASVNHTLASAKLRTKFTRRQLDQVMHQRRYTDKLRAPGTHPLSTIRRCGGQAKYTVVKLQRCRSRNILTISGKRVKDAMAMAEDCEFVATLVRDARENETDGTRHDPCGEVLDTTTGIVCDSVFALASTKEKTDWTCLAHELWSDADGL